MTRHYPKVLIVAATPLGDQSGTGITLSNLFEMWPKELLGQVHTVDSTGADESGLHSYYFAPSNAPVDAFFKRQFARGRGQSPQAALEPARGARPVLNPRRGRINSHVRATSDLTPIRYPPGLDQWIRDFKPDVVYSLLGSVRIMRIACHIADVAERPLVPHFMDDWPATQYTAGEVGGLARRSLNKWLREVMGRSPFGMAISPDMAEAYSIEYGRKFLPFGNVIRLGDYGIEAPAVADSDSGIRLMYVGGLHLERWKPLSEIAKAVEDIPEIAELIIHTPKDDQVAHGSLFRPLPKTRLAAQLAPADVPSKLQSADVLVHVESFSKESERFVRYSLSTKIPQYMASGRPIIGYGPESVASMRHIIRGESGLVVGNREPAVLKRALTKLATDASMRASFASNGRRYAEQNHELRASTKRLMDLLSSAKTG